MLGPEWQRDARRMSLASARIRSHRNQHPVGGLLYRRGNKRELHGVSDG